MQTSKIMFCTPEYTQNVSLRLSNVLDEIGVNDRMVMKRRWTVLTEESMKTVTQQLSGFDLTLYNFGSRSEGTTIVGLQPDSDTLVCNKQFNIIQDIGEWQPDFINLLMVRDENTPHGYCLLQMMYGNVPLPVVYATHDHFVRDRRGRVLMRNTWFIDNIPEGCTRHGPSQTHLGEPGFADHDLVHAYQCKSWPLEAVSWLQTETAGNRPSREMKNQSVNDGCFLVPVGRRGTEDEELQWRISTSLTERTLMFSLNISQIRCYVLLKMILKSYPELDSDDALSSFICKTVLIHCIENTQDNFWQENNLLSCLNFCLVVLYNCVSFEHCPHFIIHENNLMAGRISAELKPQIIDRIRQIILSDGRALLEIEIDQLGMRLSGQFHHIQHNVVTVIRVPSALDICRHISGKLLQDITQCLSACNSEFLSHLGHSNTENVVQIILQSINQLVGIYNEGSSSEQIASILLAQPLCSSLGSVLASNSISHKETIPCDALVWFSLGLDTGISAQLKLASMFYCTGDLVKSVYILEIIEEQYNFESIQSICGCHNHRSHLKEEFKMASAQADTDLIQYTAFCVRYLPCEFNCIPEELQHELFRSEFDTHHYRWKHDGWMDWAVVDSIPYFYFLQYKVYSNLGDRNLQERAFTNFRTVIDTDLSLGHRETALNLLGQCMEQENRLDEALNCYTASTNIRPTHNAAQFHTSQVLQKIHGGQ